MRIVFASHTAQTGVFRVGSHHLSREYALAGHDVTHVATPVSLLHLARIRQESMRRRFDAVAGSPRADEHGVHHVVPQIVAPPARLPAGLARINLEHPRKGWPRLLRLDQGPIDVLFIDQPQFADLIPKVDASLVVYRPTDAHFDARTRALEVRALNQSHAIIATSASVLADVARDHTHLPSLIVENGVEFERFAKARGAVREGAVYVGALDSRFDWDALGAMAQENPGVPFRIGGPLASTVPNKLPSNVELLGPIPYDSAPALLASAAVGLLPLSDHPGNAGRSPMKFFEYLAAGLAVVATGSPELRRRQAPGVVLYGDGKTANLAFSEALKSAETLGDDGSEYARQFDWAQRMRLSESFIKGIR
ncbi:MAG: glycosyltransferase [Mycetocola sp.]